LLFLSVSDFREVAQQSWRTDVLTPSEAAYLAQYLSPENRSANAPGRRRELQLLQERAENTNRFYAAVRTGWIVMVITLAFFLGFALDSTWAADYLARSNRGVVRCAVCYLELYLPASALLVWCLFVLARESSEKKVVETFWGPLLAPIVLGAGPVAVIHAGVIRRWHPVVRIAAYLGAIGLWFLCMIWAMGK